MFCQAVAGVRLVAYNAPMIESSGLILTIFFLYFAFMMALGWFASRLMHSPVDFFLANRNLKSWVTAISSTASSESAWAVLGTVGLAYADGLAAAWFLPGCLMGYAVNWFFVAEKLRCLSRKNNSLTIPDYLESYFQDRTKILRILSVIIIFSSMMAYVAAQLTAVGKTFDAVFGIAHHVSIPVGGIIIITYTMMGGFLAVAWTDFIQGLIMVCSIVTLTLFSVVHLGGTWVESLVVRLVPLSDPRLETQLVVESVAPMERMLVE